MAKAGDNDIIRLVRELKAACNEAEVPIVIGTNRHDKSNGRVLIDVPKRIFDKIK